MSDRITNAQMHRTMMRNITNASTLANRSTEKLSSGFDINRPSDDPFRAARSVALMSEQSSYDVYESALNQATSWTQMTDTALQGTGDLLGRARDLIIKGSNDTMATVDRHKIAEELGGIIDSIKTQANTKIAGEYVFGGTNTIEPPYRTGADDSYSGNTLPITRQIAPGVESVINEPGINVFGDDTSGIIGTLRSAQGHLNGGTPADMALLRGDDLKNVITQQDTLTSARTRVGEMQSRFEYNTQRLDTMRETTMTLLSDARDTDYPKAMMDYSRQAAAMEAALKVGQRIVSPSLVDFLK